MASDEGRAWALKLFHHSPLKQRKWAKISALLPESVGGRCLDIGSDNGVISLLLRERGGAWTSADLIPETVEAIRDLVGDPVVQLAEGEAVALPSNAFDLVVIVDLLEHLEDDRGFVCELTRIMRSGGRIVVNVPNPRPGPMRRLRYLLGQTDAAHGHVRPGYDEEALTRLLGDRFRIERVEHYGGPWSELCDAAITFALDRLKPGGRGKKGTIVTKGDLSRLKKSFRVYSLIYPLMAATVHLDRWLPIGHRTMLIVSAKKRSDDGENQERA